MSKLDPIVLIVSSPYEVEPSRAIKAYMWKNFMAGKESVHSARAVTLPYLARRAERAGVPYVIEAMPGVGYVLRRL